LTMGLGFTLLSGSISALNFCNPTDP